MMHPYMGHIQMGPYKIMASCFFEVQFGLKHSFAPGSSWQKDGSHYKKKLLKNHRLSEYLQLR
jgi:hypothetical protein